MMGHKERTRLQILLAITLCGDSMLSFLVVWRVIESHGSVIVLGMVLTGVALLAFFVQKASAKFKASLQAAPLRQFRRLRMCSAMVVVLGCICTYIADELLVMYVTLAICAVLGSLAQQSLETHFSFAAFDGELTSLEASRLLQTSIQTGAAFSALVAGVLLGGAGLIMTLSVIASCMLVGALVMSKSHTRQLANVSGVAPRLTASDAEGGPRTLLDTTCMVGGLILVGLIAVQVGAFNFLMPIVFMMTKGWTVLDFGIVSSAAAAGAILVGYPSRLLSRKSWLRQWVLIVCYLAATLLMVTSSLFFLVFVSAILLGAGNSVGRITQRSYLFDRVSSKSAAIDWVARFNFSNQIGRTGAPVAFACSISYLKWDPAHLFIFSGAAVAICSAGVLALQFVADRARLQVTE